MATICAMALHLAVFAGIVLLFAAFAAVIGWILGIALDNLID
tara:strand:- start:854 stop:979 length:126 start_codon:yes stop_codon:yes gene_type:complete